MAIVAQPFASEVRAGGRVLALLSDSINVAILRLLARAPLPTPELSRRLGPASRTTRFNRMRELEDLGLIRREKRGGSPPVTYCTLSSRGLALLPVVKDFAEWLGAGTLTAEMAGCPTCWRSERLPRAGAQPHSAGWPSNRTP
jgi:DNA-binding HxlR family transcriptional regulator